MFFRNENVFVFKLIISLISITGLSLEVLSTNMEEREMQSALHHIPSGKCLLPLFSIGTKYSRNECSSFEECIAIEENEIIDSFQHIFINCQEGFALRYVNASVAICINGKWQLSPTACVKLCEPIKSTSLQVFCKYNGESVNCEEPVRAGTVARLSCREGYQQELPEMYFNDTCLSSGNWKYSGVQRCSFACGQFNSEVKIMPSRTYYPWHAGVYKASKNGTVLPLCGGTLITPTVVLTAAHCVTKTEGEVIAANKFRIAFAKFYVNYDDERDTEAQYRNVSHIYIPPEYKGQNLIYSFDIALLELTSSVPSGLSIMPACVDRYNNNVINSSMLGMVVGWSLHSLYLQSEGLKKVKVPYITLEECRNAVGKYKNQITNDKFCTLERNDSNTTLPIDSGSGILFKFGRKGYIHGVASIKATDKVYAFTDIRFPGHVKFIDEVLKKVEENDGI